MSSMQDRQTPALGMRSIDIGRARKSGAFNLPKSVSMLEKNQHS